MTVSGVDNQSGHKKATSHFQEDLKKKATLASPGKPAAKPTVHVPAKKQDASSLKSNHPGAKPAAKGAKKPATSMASLLKTPAKPAALPTVIEKKSSIAKKMALLTPNKTAASPIVKTETKTTAAAKSGNTYYNVSVTNNIFIRPADQAIGVIGPSPQTKKIYRVGEETAKKTEAKKPVDSYSNGTTRYRSAYKQVISPAPAKPEPVKKEASHRVLPDNKTKIKAH